MTRESRIASEAREYMLLKAEIKDYDDAIKTKRDRLEELEAKLKLETRAEDGLNYTTQFGSYVVKFRAPSEKVSIPSQGARELLATDPSLFARLKGQVKMQTGAFMGVFHV